MVITRQWYNVHVTCIANKVQLNTPANGFLTRYILDSPTHRLPCLTCTWGEQIRLMQMKKRQNYALTTRPPPRSKPCWITSSKTHSVCSRLTRLKLGSSSLYHMAVGTLSRQISFSAACSGALWFKAAPVFYQQILFCITTIRPQSPISCPRRSLRLLLVPSW